MSKSITKEKIREFQYYLYENEKSGATIQKYIHVLEELREYLDGREMTKELLVDYRDQLRERLKARTVNVKLSAINAYLTFSRMTEYKVKFLRHQRKAFVEDNRELTKEEYRRLLKAAKSMKNERLYHLMVTICSTGIRIGELKYITVEAVKKRKAEISLKGKERTVLLTRELQKCLLKYIRVRGIESGCVFCTKSGMPLDRSNICHDMKKLCTEANVHPDKVFPHNLRHLFARTFYGVEKNLSHLADILGHSSIETTRIYVAASARVHERTLKKMQLVT